jgi:hypothetical protein
VHTTGAASAVLFDIGKEYHMSSETLEATASVVETDDTEFVAVGAGCWGRDKYNITPAVMNALRAGSWLPNSTNGKPTKIAVVKVTGDWELDGFGTIRAKAIKTVAEFEVPAKLHQALVDKFCDLEEIVSEHAVSDEPI